ncbi:hypothetical protein [Bacillus sp. WP8]|nr:hypothetical protein [Bacillus sp. WP8]
MKVEIEYGEMVKCGIGVEWIERKVVDVGVGVRKYERCEVLGFGEGGWTF